jgi:uncharacterized membrane protein YedE/YeeE
MIASAPYIPLHGSSPAVYHTIALLIGVGFGFFLERAGFGSAKRLTAVFTLRDWRVYKVMFTALITAMLGAQLLSGLGLLESSLVEVGATMLWPMLVGGLLFGVGFYFGGFCPGTAVVSAVRGRLDAVVFLVGVTLGIYGFALFFDGPGQADWFQDFYQPVGAHVMVLYGAIPGWVIAILITIGVILSFRHVYLLEQRFSLMTPEQLERGERRPPVVRPAPGALARIAVGGAAAVLLALVVVRPSDPESVVIGSETPRVVSFDTAAVVDPLSLVGWVVSDAHRLSGEQPANSFVVDVRPDGERAAAPVHTAIEVDPDADALAPAIQEALDDALAAADRNKPVVLLASSDATYAPEVVVAQLRRQGVNAFELSGGSDAWQSTVFAPDESWPAVVATGGGSTDDMIAYRREVAAWLLGQAESPPPYLPIPGAEQLPSEVATVAATGTGGGGCG